MIKILKKYLVKIFKSKDNKEKNLLSGESPLLVFISSVMNEEVNWAREKLTKHINNLRGFATWTFEYTPASSENVQDGYLRKVRESDLVVWLVGSYTSKAVEKEIREALSSNKRLLVFKLATTKQRDRNTQNLLSEVGLRAKYRDLSDNNLLLEEFEKSIGDEMIRAFRGKPGLSRLSIINEIFLESRARCIERWQAAGINLEKAMELFDNKNVGRPSAQLIRSLQKNNLVILLGDFGSGKSLMAERLLQDYILNSIEDSSKPIAVYVSANKISDELINDVERKTEGLGNPRLQGAFIVIDGVDEANLNDSYKILSQSRILARTWPSTSIVITSRPLAIYSEAEEKININLLNEKQIVEIINEINNSEEDTRIFYNLAPSIRVAIQRPFFAILWARYLRSRHENNRSIKTTGELFNFFIEDVIPFSDEKVSQSLNLLELLAQKMVDNSLKFISWREIGNLQDINSLVETRLVQKIDNRIGFPLPILAQWLAAHALVKNTDLIIDIVADLVRLDKWYYPLIIVVSMFSYEDVKRVFSPVVQRNPGLAAQIINEGIDISYFDKNNQMPDAKECGLRIRETYLTWLSGIGDLAKYIAPTLENGKLQNIGVTISDNGLDVAWNNGPDEVDDVTELPVGFFVNGLRNPGWYFVQSSHIGSQMGWAWRWSYDHLSERLKSFISRKAYAPRDSFVYKERLWVLALSIMGYGELYYNPIGLNELEVKLNEILKKVGDKQYTEYHELSNFIKNNRVNNFDEFALIWPSADLDSRNGGWIWEPYSEQQILNRSKLIYSAALREYDKLVNGLFVKFKPRMLIGTLLPVKMHGQIIVSDSQDFGGGPELDWYFEPLPLNSDSFVDFSLSKTRKKIIDVQELFQMNQRMRPASREWLSAFTHMGGLDIFGSSPLTKIVYDWLESDLKETKWIK